LRRREFGLSSVCAISGALLAYVIRLVVGGWPNAIVVAGLGLMSLGAVLVVSRFSRLGPFRGELGSPWFESELRDSIVSEANRAARYARPMSVVAVRTHGQSAGWETVVRGVDRVVNCRGGWTVLLLPETDPHGAMVLMRRIGAADAAAQAAVVSLPEDVANGADLVATLASLVTQPNQPGNVLTWRQGQVQEQRLAT
jgi:hypothetical protein